MSRWVCLRCFASNEGAFAACQSCGLPRGEQPEPGEGHPETIQAAPTAGRRVLGLMLRYWWVLLLVAGPIGGLIFNAQRDDGGAIARAGDLVVSDLRVGDCFDLKGAEDETINDVTARPCGEAHEFELMFIGSPTFEDYPSELGFGDWVRDNCVPAFAEYIGSEYQASVLDIAWFTPLEGAWDDGDHTVQCAIYDPGDSQLTGILRGSRR